MKFLKSSLWAMVVSFVLVVPGCLFAETNCEEGSLPLNTAQPKGLTPQEIIEKFAARETVFVQARNN